MIGYKNLKYFIKYSEIIKITMITIINKINKCIYK